MKKYKDCRVGVFVDDANMFHTQREAGLKIDWGKFKSFLEENFKVGFIKYYRGVYSKSEAVPKEVRKKHLRYASILRRIGFEVISRDLKKIYTDKKKTKFVYKCDFDAEIGFDVAANLQKIDLVILVSGDSDFVCLSRKLVGCEKGFLAVCFEYKAPWEIRKIHHIFLEDLEEKEIFRKKNPDRNRGEHYNFFVS